MRRSFAALAALVSVAACAPKESATTDSATPPAAVSAQGLQADEDSIRALSSRWLQLSTSHDTVGIAAMFADDGYEFVTNAPAAKGPGDVAKALGPQFRLKDMKTTFETTDVVVASGGDLAVERGTFRLTYTNAAGKPVDDHGNYVTAWKKVNGQWKVLYDISASEVPPAGG